MLANYLYNYDINLKYYFIDKRIKASYKQILSKNIEI